MSIVFQQFVWKKRSYLSDERFSKINYKVTTLNEIKISKDKPKCKYSIIFCVTETKVE